jgi:uncharacterized protein YbbC (DUF1343 family)
MMSAMNVRLGSERLLAAEGLKNKRVGVVSNPASVDARFQHIVRAIAHAPAVTLGAIFGPQHGYRADVQDNMIETGHANDPTRGVPVYSLYSETREPTAEMLKGLDALVIDLQDVGSRIYTFVYTMANCLRACRKHGVPVIVTDRPNPIGGEQIGGPMLAEGFESFVGQFPIPMRHGMTIAELARFFNEAFGIGADLTVVPMEYWQRRMHYEDTGLPWVMPSPNMPTVETAVVYPGTVLFEGTNVSEGRGTTRPFELIGAPWVDAEALADTLAAYDLPGVFFRPVVFEPTFQKHAKQACGGCQIHVLDRRAFPVVEAAVAVLAEIRAQNPARFEWRQPPYEYEHTRLPFDILAGSSELRQQIEAGMPVQIISEAWTSGLERFRAARKPYLMY